MKVVVSKQKEVEELEYPRLRIYKSGLIVLFSNSTTGMVVSEDRTYEVGEFSDNWDSLIFKDYNGNITLSND
tara:strand:+ start:27 stop:242 length:216 start_codon:yes stop_codon:yes gene_type:complete